MKCDECGERDSVFHIVTIKDGERSERNLCPQCMAKYRREMPELNIKSLAGLLSNLLQDGNKTQKEEPDPSTAALCCPQCGMTYGEFSKGGMLGCSECYKAFKEPLGRLLQRIHGSSQHSGHVPAGAHSGSSIRMNIERLKAQLHRAVEAEEYEEAAKYRDAIRTLNMQLRKKEECINVPPTIQIEANEVYGGADDE